MELGPKKIGQKKNHLQVCRFCCVPIFPPKKSDRLAKAMAMHASALDLEVLFDSRKRETTSLAKAAQAEKCLSLVLCEFKVDPLFFGGWLMVS